MSGRPKIFGSGKSAGALTAWMKQSSPKLVVIQHVRLGSIGYHVFEPNKLSWLLAGVPDDITLAEALELEDAEPVAPDVVESLLHEAEDGEDLTFDEAPGPWLPPPEPTRRTPPVSQTPEPASTAAPAAFVNFGFFEIRGRSLRALPLNEGFRANSRYRLSVGIASTPDARFGGEDEQPPVLAPDKGLVTLQVAVFIRRGPLLVAGKRLRALPWNGGPTETTADFIIEASDTPALVDAGLDVFIYHRANVLYIGRFRITVGEEDYEWSRAGQPIRWEYANDSDRIRTRVFRQFSELGLLSERGLSLVLQRGDGGDRYILTALVGRTELPARIEITREEMASFVVSAREMMDRLRRHPVYVRGGYDEHGTYTGVIAGAQCYDRTGTPVPGAREAFRSFLDDMALLGSRACDRLFQSEDGQVLRAALDQHLRPGDLIQIAIDRNAVEFVWPWAWLYGKTIDPSHRFRADANQFWGYRYVIEQISGFGDFDGDGPTTSQLPADPLRVQIGFWNFEPETKAQMEYFERAAASAGGKIACTFWDDDARWEEFLPKCDSQLIYFFTHGHTAKPYSLSDVRTYDMLAAWKKWASETPPDESEAMKAYRERALAEIEELEGAHSLLDESFIRLRRGMLLLRELHAGMNLRQSHPLVFLNMCESAQVYPSITGGLIDAFLEKGARAVIGTEIPMIASFADLISREFFDAFLFGAAPATGGEILFRLRRKHLDAGNPLGFAYTLFGDAMVSVARAGALQEEGTQ